MKRRKKGRKEKKREKIKKEKRTSTNVKSKHFSGKKKQRHLDASNYSHSYKQCPPGSSTVDLVIVSWLDLDTNPLPANIK